MWYVLGEKISRRKNRGEKGSEAERNLITLKGEKKKGENSTTRKQVKRDKVGERHKPEPTGP